MQQLLYWSLNQPKMMRQPKPSRSKLPHKPVVLWQASPQPQARRSHTMTTSGVEPRAGAGMRLTLRDITLLQTLYTARYLTTPQIEKLFWPGDTTGRTKACQQRLRLLHYHGLVRRISLPIRRGEKPKPFVYALDRKGAELLVSELGTEPSSLDWRPKAQEENYPFLEHLLTTTDFRIALTRACEQAGVVLQEWVDERELKSSPNLEYVTLRGPQGSSLRAALVPDAYFVLAREGKQGIFFVEVDLKTVTVSPSQWERRGWVRRIRTYDAYFRSEAYRTRYGSRRARVLTVTPSALRLRNLKRATEAVFQEMRQAGEDASAQNRFWFTVFEQEMDPGRLLTEPIWQLAGSDAPRALLE